MRHITGTTTWGQYSLDYVADVPEPADILKALPPRAAKLAIEYLSVKEEYIREHLNVGSTPPTKVPVWKVPWRLKVIRKAVWSMYESSRGCICL